MWSAKGLVLLIVSSIHIWGVSSIHIWGSRPIHAQPQHACSALTRELVQAHAKDNVIMFMVLDQQLLGMYANSWLESVRAAGITNYIVGAMDPQTSLNLPKLMPQTQCFNAPVAGVPTAGGAGYRWGSEHFVQTTWKKVHIAQKLYALGFHVLFSDADVSWMHDPLPYLKQHLAHDGAPHGLFATDSLDTHNQVGDEGLEKGTSPFFNINTGIYFIKQHTGGQEFFQKWLSFDRRGAGHDQDGLNNAVRGKARASDPNLPMPQWQRAERIVWAAVHNSTAVSYLPVHVIANSYTYHVGRVHRLYNSTLLAAHWVWSGKTPESKVANMRDAMRYSDPPAYYSGSDLTLLTMDIDRPVPPPDFNQRNIDETESMVRFHLNSANYQLQQAYYGLMAAAALRRSFVLPGFHCFCAKNWYMTQACRINGEKHTQFPYMCLLSDVLRSKLLSQGIKIPFATYEDRVVHVREWPFLSHPKVPDHIKSSRVVLAPGMPRDSTSSVSSFEVHLTEHPSGQGMHAAVPWPLNTRELEELVDKHFGSFRIIHLANATQLLSKGWATAEWQRTFDTHIQRYATRWCCRDPKVMAALQLPRHEELQVVPQKWRDLHVL
ncbi:nucleotide-diphospho-sugar transferase-domain-containing protein [Dunaliella salina]|uniref:Nucleotide-diphospho-sugar transferase-domain-containing protein n=1 Tax=Dunaliella salina TaxID=3046 RepID=A0ABQ7GY28_DUNSA|nr:nucleotide-diphospho-sugar transferase-domain-containing protein [Dunaliella salina]|eukprot:KAF5839487.1 nucleotide-diphospho-sugar transferase-domain-containing protein [Dunaliella salina]